MSRLQPIGIMVLVEPTKKLKITEGGIIIPDTSNGDVPMSGSVVEIGDNVYSVVKGDKVIYSKTAGIAYQHEGIAYLLMRDGDIIAKIVEDTQVMASVDAVNLSEEDKQKLLHNLVATKEKVN